MGNVLAINGGNPVRSNPIFYSPVIEEDEINAVVNLLRTRKITALSSNIVTEFEIAFAKHIGSKHCVAMNSGTAALHAAVAACGVGPGDEVVVPAYTFVATASCVLHHNAIPIFADIDERTYCLDPNDFERKITDKTKAVLPVHLFGHPADMNAITRIADKHGIAVIEDAAQAHGTKYDGKPVGTIGGIGCFSLQESKNITTGEGGLIVTDNDEYAEECRLIRHHGQSAQYKYVKLGWNYRMTGLEAAIGLVQLKKLGRLNAIRKEMADYYTKHLKGIEGLILPETVDKNAVHSYHVYAVRLDSRKLGVNPDKFIAAMAAEGIRTPLIYPEPVYLNPLFKQIQAYPNKCPFSCPHYGRTVEYKTGLCPTAERITREMVRLPLHPAIPMEDIKDVVTAVRKIIENRNEIA